MSDRRPDAGAPWGGNPEATRAIADGLTDLQEYSDCLAILEAQSREALAGTCVTEGAILNLLKLVRLLHKSDRDFGSCIEPHAPRIMALMSSVVRAKSLDVPFVGSMERYHNLVDYVSRVWQRDEVMLDDPGFWPWLDHSYPCVSRLLRADMDCIKRTSSLVQALSRKFRSRKYPHSSAYMRAVDGICSEAMATCPDKACDYAKKASESWESTEMELATLAAVGRHFRVGRIDPKIPGSESRADMTFEREGREWYAEVYSHADYGMVGTEIFEDIVPGEEWSRRFRKAQIKSLREAGVPTVYVMRLDNPKALPGATRSREFLAEARRKMPGDSDIVVILRGVEVASLRGGRAVEPSALAERLGRAIWEAMPENAPGARPWP